MKTITIMLVLAMGCSSDSSPKPDPNADPGPNATLGEKDKSKLVEREVAPGKKLVFKRERDDGWRRVELVYGGKTYTFHDDPDRYMLDANGEAFGDRAVICGMATPDPAQGAGLDITCAVAEPAGMGPLKQITTPTSAWLGDVCIDGDRVTLLYSAGTRPFEPDAPYDTEPCLSLAWSPTDGWAQTASPSATCACNLRDGTPCTDNCFTGTGVRKAGACDTTGLAPVCNDGNPNTDDFCTGKVDELCYAVQRN